VSIDEAIADLSECPILFEFDGFGNVQIEGLSRISNYAGRSETSASPEWKPRPIVLQRVVGGHESLWNWLSDPGQDGVVQPKDVTVHLRAPCGRESPDPTTYQLRLLGVRPISAEKGLEPGSIANVVIQPSEIQVAALDQLEPLPGTAPHTPALLVQGSGLEFRVLAVYGGQRTTYGHAGQIIPEASLTLEGVFGALQGLLDRAALSPVTLTVQLPTGAVGLGSLQMKHINFFNPLTPTRLPDIGLATPTVP
jgi:hypothetical protein